MDFQERIQPAEIELHKLQSDSDYVWGMSVVRGGDGWYHGFASVWPKAFGFNPGWLRASRIAHTVASAPEGPFEVAESLDVLNGQDWASGMTHNPTVHRFGDRYYLYYTGTTCPEPFSRDAARANQRIGVAVADSPAGPWNPCPSNPILKPRPGHWDHSYVTNPAVLEADGRYYLYYKARNTKGPGWLTQYGVAVADSPVGPFRVERTDNRLFKDNVEDAYVWREAGHYWMIAKAMDGARTAKGNGLLYQSEDPIEGWRPVGCEPAWTKTLDWREGGTEFPHVERPQLLIENGRPICLYNAVGDFGEYAFNVARRLSPTSSIPSLAFPSENRVGIPSKKG